MAKKKWKKTGIFHLYCHSLKLLLSGGFHNFGKLAWEVVLLHRRKVS